MDAMGTQIIIKARVTFVFHGYGDLTLTDTTLIWNKSATSYLAFGVMNAVTDDHVMIPLKSISVVDKYTYIPGGGLKIIKNDGQEFKFSFKHSKDFNVIWNYLQQSQNEMLNFEPSIYDSGKNSKKVFCQYCGTKIAHQNACFCPSCGKKL